MIVTGFQSRNMTAAGFSGRQLDKTSSLSLSSLPLETLNGHVSSSKNGLRCSPGDGQTPARGELLFFCGVVVCSVSADDVGQTFEAEALGTRWPSVASSAVSNSPNAFELVVQTATAASLSLASLTTYSG